MRAAAKPTTWREFSTRFARSEAGATSLEYALMLTMISIACLASFQLLGGTSGGAWGGTANKVGTAMSSAK